MEDIGEKSYFLNIKSKSELNFGKFFSQKISELKIFIYGLKEVIKYQKYNNIKL